MTYLISFILLGGTIGREPQPPNVIAQMLDHKLEMQDNYSLRFRIETHHPGAPPGAPRKEAFTAAIWRAGDKLRVDAFDRESDPAKDELNTVARHITCRNCERANFTIVTTVFPPSLGQQAVVAFRDSRTGPINYFVEDLDWRFLGLCNSPLSGYDKISIAQSLRKRMANPLLRTSERERDGGKCLVTELKIDKWTNDIWFGQKEKFNPVWFAGEGEMSSHGMVRLTTEVRWKTTAGKHLYPERIKHTSLRNGTLNYEEVIDVLHADFDTPVDPSAFTLAGLGLNNTQLIEYPDLKPDDWPVWRDGRPDHTQSDRAKRESAQVERPDAVAPLPLPAAPYPVSSNTSLVIAIVSGVVAVISMAIAIIYRWRRK